MLRRALFTAVLALSAAAAWSAASVTIADLLARGDAFHGRAVTVSGTAGEVRQKTSKAGRAYTTFPLFGAARGERVNVFAWGHPPVSERARLTVTGTYAKEKVVGVYTFTNEIEATEIR
jgi:hypothetical protein